MPLIASLIACRYVSTSEGVRASCELWKRVVLEEVDGLGAVLAAVREAETGAATKAEVKAEVKAMLEDEAASAAVAANTKAPTTAPSYSPSSFPIIAPTTAPSSLPILAAAKAWKRARTDRTDETLDAANDETLDGAANLKPSPSSSALWQPECHQRSSEAIRGHQRPSEAIKALWQPERIALEGIGRTIWCHSSLIASDDL